MNAHLRLAERDVSRKLTHKVSGFAPREVSATKLFIKAGDVVHVGANAAPSSRKQKTPALFRARGLLFAEDGLAVTY
jgi:hypothetical protein